MNSNTDQEKKTRDWFKCSACRQRKKKASRGRNLAGRLEADSLETQCEPQPRDWDGAKQKCQHCQAHGLSCGPNYRSNEDPEVIRLVSENPLAREEGSSRRRSQASVHRPRPSVLQSPTNRSGTSASVFGSIEGQNTLSFNVGLAEDRIERIGALSNEGLVEEASSR